MVCVYTYQALKKWGILEILLASRKFIENKSIEPVNVFKDWESRQEHLENAPKFQGNWHFRQPYIQASPYTHILRRARRKFRIYHMFLMYVSLKWICFECRLIYPHCRFGTIYSVMWKDILIFRCSWQSRQSMWNCWNITKRIWLKNRKKFNKIARKFGLWFQDRLLFLILYLRGGRKWHHMLYWKGMILQSPLIVLTLVSEDNCTAMGLVWRCGAGFEEQCS